MNCPKCEVDMDAWKEVFGEAHNCEHVSNILSKHQVIGILFLFGHNHKLSSKPVYLVINNGKLEIKSKVEVKE